MPLNLGLGLERLANMAREAFGLGNSTAPATITPATPAAEDAGPKVGVMVGSQNAQFGAVMRGTMGIVQHGSFRIDSAYEQVADLFYGVGNGPTPLAGGSYVVTLDVEERDWDALRANLMRGAVENWGGLYKQLARGNEAMLQMLLEAQQQKEKASVRRYIDGLHLQSFDVPVTYTQHIEQPYEKLQSVAGQPAAYRTTHGELLAAAGAPQQETLRIGGDHAAASPADAELSPAQQQHDGPIDLSVANVVHVLARDEDQAVRVLAHILELREYSREVVANTLDFGEPRVLTVEMRPRATWAYGESDRMHRFDGGGFDDVDEDDAGGFDRMR